MSEAGTPIEPSASTPATAAPAPATEPAPATGSPPPEPSASPPVTAAPPPATDPAPPATVAAAPAPATSAGNPLRDALTAVSSLKLTVTLLGLSMLLVFSATWAQIDRGIWSVQHDYFRSFMVRGALPGGLHLWMPAGYLVGSLLLLNLVAAHAARFRLTRDRIGIILIHLGLILLLVGELLTSLYARETNMDIAEGEAVNYSVDTREFELAVVDLSDAQEERVVAVSARALRDAARASATIDDAALPFLLAPRAYMANSDIRRTEQGGGPPAGTIGAGVELSAREAPPVAGIEDGMDMPAAIVDLRGRDGVDLGTWLFSPLLREVQAVQTGGRSFQVALRFRRHYHPFWVALADFRFDRYEGTEVAKNFSSDVRIFDPERREDREVRISMNEPLRYGGMAFYQSSFDRATERRSVLQVVRNPAWTMPYVAVTLGALGMCIHFGALLTRFLRRQAKARAEGGES